MNANFKILVTGFIIIVVAYFLIVKRNRRTLETFKSKTLSGKECIPWKNAVQYMNYGDSKTCKNPEKDVNGNWCYTDTYGNYEYCDDYSEGCIKVKVLDGCFTPDKNGYQMVIYNSQPFTEKFLELDKVVDSTNQIWCLDESCRFLRTTKKSEYLNYEWTNMIGDSLNNYNPNSTQFYLISGMGVKKGGYVDTQKNNRDEEISSLMASEVCYLYLRDYFSRERNSLMRCILSEQINIQSLEPSYHINMRWRNNERQYINLGKKIMIDDNGYIFGIHREKMQNGKGIHWGDMVIGLEDNGEVKFNMLGNTFPEKVVKVGDYEYNTDEDADENKTSRRYLPNTNKKLFSNEMLQFVHRASYTLNELIEKKESNNIDEFMDRISGKTQVNPNEASLVEEFNRYLKFRIILNNDFAFIDDRYNKIFTYTLKKNNVINPMFDNDDVLSLLNEFPLVRLININRMYKNKLEFMVNELNFTSTFNKLNDINKLRDDKKILEDLNNEESQFNINNLKYSVRIQEENTSIVEQNEGMESGQSNTIHEEINGILDLLKGIELKEPENLAIVQRIRTLKTSYDRDREILEKEFKESDFNKKHNAVINEIINIQNKLDLKKTNPTDILNFKKDYLGLDIDVSGNLTAGEKASKKIYYKVIAKFMDYFTSKTESIYDSLERSVQSLNDLIDNNKDTIKSRLTDSPCYSADYKFGDFSQLKLDPNPISRYNWDDIPEGIRNNFKKSAVTSKRYLGTRIRYSIKDKLVSNTSDTVFRYLVILKYGRRNYYYLASNEMINTGQLRYGFRKTTYFNAGRGATWNLEFYLIGDNPSIIGNLNTRLREGTAIKRVRRGEFSSIINGLINNLGGFYNLKKNYYLGRGKLSDFRTFITTKINEIKNTQYETDLKNYYLNLYPKLNSNFNKEIQSETNKELIKKRAEFANQIDRKILELKKITTPHEAQVKGNVRYNLTETNEKIQQLSSFKDSWGQLPDFIMNNRICSYVYTSDAPISSPSLSPSPTGSEETADPSTYYERSEKNCFQDYATRQIVNLQNLRNKVEEIKDLAYLPTYEIDFKENGADDRAFKDLNELKRNIRIVKIDGEYVYPEVASLLGEIEIIMYNLGRKEALLRYNTNFFYMLDELLEEENKEGDFTNEQKELINKMFKLFFDVADEDGDFIETEPPIESMYDDYEELTPAESLPELYNLEKLSELFPADLWLEGEINRFNQPGITPSESVINNKCGDMYKNGEFIDKIRIKKYVIHELMKDYGIKKKKLQTDFTLNFTSSLNNFKFDSSNHVKMNCSVSRNIQFDKLLVNYVRDDVKLFESGNVNVLQIYSSIINSLKEFETDNNLIFSTDRISGDLISLESDVTEQLTDTINRISLIVENLGNNSIREFLENNNITLADVPNIVKDNIQQIEDNLNLNNPPADDSRSSSDSDDELNTKEFRIGFSTMKTFHTQLTDYYSQTLEILLRTFPNAAILGYVNYLNDYNRCAELDIQRKIEVLNDTLKIMGEITNMEIHEGLNLGVVDFNLTKDYLYIDYVTPSVGDNNSNVTRYNWEDVSATNMIGSLNIISVRLKKDYIDNIFENRYSVMNTLKYIDKDRYENIIANSIEDVVPETITTQNKTMTLYEKNEEGEQQKTLRQELNIASDIFSNYINEFNEYRDLEGNQNENYEALMRQIFFGRVNEQILRNTFVEQGRAFIKQNIDVENKLHVQLKEYDSSLSDREQTLNYLKSIQESIIERNIDTTTNKVRYFYDYSDKDNHPNLLSDGTKGSGNDKMIYHFIPGSLVSGTGIYGLMKYNFSNSLYTGNDNDRGKIGNIYFKKNVFFQIYGKQEGGENTGPIELINKTNLAYVLTPYIKYSHGLIFTEDGKIKQESYYGLLYWFFKQQKQEKFTSKDEWYKFYKTLVLEGLYNIAADPYKFKINTNFANQFEEYVASLESKPDIGKLNENTMEILKELQNFIYDKDLKLETKYPQIKLHKLKSKRYGNQVFVEIVRFNPNGDEILEKDKQIISLVNDYDKENRLDLRSSNDSFMDKYNSHIQDKKNNLTFSYKYYRLINTNKFNLLRDSDFCENSEAKNKFNSLWRFKVINNFQDYKRLVEGEKPRDEATNRTKGLYDLNNIYRDDYYYNDIKDKRDNSKNPTVVITSKKILKDRKKNMLEGTGYPFMVVFQVRDYEGYPCQEGDVNSQKIFLTYNLNNSFIFNNLDESPNSLINQKEGPIISEEFLAYTGLGASIRFGYQKVRGSTPIKASGVCDTSNPYDPLPGYSDDCGAESGSCTGTIVGKTRLDGTPKCVMDDPEVKTKPISPLDVSVTGNVALDACDIYKVKGNKKIKYKLEKMFGYNDAGKYQLKNQYTLKYGDYYFYYKKKGNKILFKDEFDTNPEVVSNYAFNITQGEDKYGIYILLSPHNGAKGDNTKYLTRIINIFDKHFDEWKLEKRMDKIEDKKKDYVRDIETADKKIFGEPDTDFYAQKFNLPDDLIMNIATQEGIKSELLDKMKSDVAKGNYLFCNLGGQGENPLCKGDFNAKPAMTLDEENEILRQQATQISALMKRFDNVPSSFFEKYPQNEELLKFMKKTVNTIRTASDFVYKRIKDVNWVVKTQLQTNQEAKKINKAAEKISANNLSNSMNNLIDKEGIMAEALKDMESLKFDTNTQQSQCKSLEGFSNMDNSPAPSPVSKFDRNISGRYYNYVQDEIAKKKKNITELNDKIHTLLSGLNKLSDGMDLSGEKKQMLLSEMIQEKNKLEKMIFDIKNYEQQDRINRIGEKLNDVEKIRSEMEEDDFLSKRPQDDSNNVSIISREDGEFLNMYRIEEKQNADHLVFINGGCLEYEPEKKNIKVEHCRADVPNQQFKIYRMEDKNDMDNFNLKNTDRGIDRAFDMVMSKDGMCLHKENGELSFRNCDNAKNQYWDYSNITGPCNM